jgi:hypothetical protein
MSLARYYAALTMAASAVVTPPPTPAFRGLISDFNPARSGGVLYAVDGSVLGLKDWGQAGKDLLLQRGTAPLLVNDNQSGYPSLETVEDTLLGLNYGQNYGRQYTLLVVMRFMGVRVQYQFPMEVIDDQSFMYFSYGDVRSHWGVGYGGEGNVTTSGSLFLYALSGGEPGEVVLDNFWYQTGRSLRNLNAYGDGGAYFLQQFFLGKTYMRVMRAQVYNYQLSSQEASDKIAALQARYPNLYL